MLSVKVCKVNFIGRDYKHSLEMQKLLKNEIGSVDVFLLLFSGASTRFGKIFQFQNP